MRPGFCFTLLLATFSEAGAQTQFREELSLDGPWQIVFDAANRGRAEGWQKRAAFDRLPAIESIKAPIPWETVRQDYEGVAWYRRRFAVPANWKDRFIQVRFGAVNYRAEVWVNEHPAGYHEGGYTPFELRVGDLVKPGGENEITVRVIGPIVAKDLYVDGYGRNDTPHWRGAITGGIWQPVTLVATAPVYIQDVFVEPDIRNSRAAVNVTVMNSTRKAVEGNVGVQLESEPDSARQSALFRPGRNQLRLEIPVTRLRLWSPDSPALYTAVTALEAGGSRDGLRTRFGMREFTIQGNRYCLNGKPVFIKAGFWEGFYPGTLAFPPSTEIVRKEIRLAKEAGFNVLRPWRKPPPPPILDLADEMGIMVIGAPPIECMGYWPEIVPETERRLAIEVREMVARDRNHPSLIYWEIFNEIIRFGLKRLKHEMALIARETDPTRIVVDESGGWADGAAAYPPRSFEPEPFNELHVYLRAPVDDRIYSFFRKIGGSGFDPSMLSGRDGVPNPGKLTFISEIGFGGWPDFVANVEEYKRSGNPITPDYRNHVAVLESFNKAYEELNWREIFPDVRSMLLDTQRIQAEGNKLQLEAARLNPDVGGYCLHAYTDGDWVVGAGVLDLFRNKKLQYDAVKLVQRPLYLALRVNPPNVYAERGAELQVDSVNELEPTSGTLSIEVKAPNGETVYSTEQKTRIDSGIHELTRTPLKRFPLSGAYRLKMGTDAFSNEFEFFVLKREDLAPPKQAVAMLDPEGKTTAFLSSAGVPTKPFSENLAERVPVVVTTENATDERAFRNYAAMLDYVERGGVAILLRTPLPRAQGSVDTLKRRFGVSTVPQNQNLLLRTGLFPLQLGSRLATGHWVPVNHAARRHPIFDGLPIQGFLGQTYQNVVAAETITGLREPPVVGALSVSLNNNTVDRDYRGLGDVWWGSDIAVVPHGKGRLLVSTMILAEHLGKDPVADKLLFNMIRWAGSLPGSLDGRTTPIETRYEKPLRAFHTIKGSQ